MMELTCAYLLVLFSLVCATPYGYGVKGGASAKAEASASAGAFDGVRGLPLTIPSGSGFSGSYSKSSSSSFASSSASASSSSSSFSFGGSGSPGFGANIVAGENTGCGSGACSKNKNDQFSHPQGSDASGYSGAHAAAGSKAVAGVYNNGNINGGCGLAGCSKNNINGLPSAHGTDGADSLQGAAGDSAPGSNRVAGIYNNKNEGCGSGDCSKKNTNDQLSASDSNGSLQGYNSANAEAVSKAAAGIPAYTNEGCSSGSCANKNVDGLPDAQGSAAAGSPLGHNAANLNAGSKPCFGSDCSNQSPSCEGSGCSFNTQTKLPSQPNFGPYDIPAKKSDSKLSSDKALNGYDGAASNSNCANGNCGRDSPNNYGNENKYHQVPGVSKCDSPNCNGRDSNAATAFPSSGFGPSIPATYLTTPIASANCNYPGCQPTSPSSGKPSSYNVPLHPSTDFAKDKLPCNDGNCGTNQYKYPYSTGNIGQGAAPSGSVEPITCTSPNCAKQPTSTPGCKTPNCAPNYSSAPTGSGAGLIYHPGVSGSTFQPTSPSYVSSATPSHKPLGGQFNSGCKTPDCVGYTPGHSFTGSPSGPSLNHPVPQFPVGGSSHVTPSYTNSVGIPNTPTVAYTPSCKTPNCVPQAPGNTGSYGTAIPIPGVVPEHKEPTAGYTGGFGGPAGILKPNEFSGPTNTHFVKPSHTGTPNIVKPSEEPSGDDLPPYNGGFGGPSGILKPNEFDSKQPLTPTYTPASTLNPASHKNPTYTGGFGAPSGTLKPNEISGTANSNVAYGGISTPTTPGQKVSTPFGSFSSPSGTYKPGVGTTIGITPVVHLGTPVVLQPISYPTHSSLPVPTGGLGASLVASQPNTYVTGNPASNPIGVHHGGRHEHLPYAGSDSSADKNSPHYSGNFGGTSGEQKPTDLSSNSYSKPSTTTTNGIKPSSCSSGSCGNEAGNAVAVAKADAVAYTGGFGGPPGLLKPHDGGKSDSKLPSAVQFGSNHGLAGSHSGIDSSGTEHENDGKFPVNGASIQSGAAAHANAVAQATATAGATSGAYGHNNGYSGSHGGVHGNGHKLGTGCGGGCGSGNYHSNDPDFSSSSVLSTAKAGALDSADAKSLASAVSGARAFGGSGSFASSSASAHASAGYATKGGYGK